MRFKLLLFVSTFFVWGIHSYAQDTGNIFELNRKIGRGINLGNMFEAPSEAEWGNPYRADYFEKIANLGFQSVRLPIRWDTPQRTQLTPTYRLDPSFLARIKVVVDDANRQGLYVIINMHHHQALFDTPEQAKPRFLAQWEQIATYFKDYDKKLVFEVLNEPNGKLTPELWNAYFAEALGSIRKTNPTRAVIMGLPLYGGLGGLTYIKLPKDDHLIISPHYYSPFRFTHQRAEWVGEQSTSWLGTQWKDLEFERDEIKQDFEPLVQFSKQNNIPVYVGEFGAYNKADLASRARWTTFLARWFEEQGFSWSYWEFSAGFGIYNPDAGQYLQPLVDALLQNPIPSPTPVYVNPLYGSAFATTLDGWNLYTQASTAAVMRQVSGALQVDIRKISDQNWHIQLVKNTIPLVKNKLYHVVVKGFSNSAQSFTVYVGKSSAPYNAYSDYKNYTMTNQEKEVSFVFKMTEASDPMGRLIFDLGSQVGTLSLTSVKIEELEDTITGLSPSDIEVTIVVSPNPTQGDVKLIGLKGFYTLTIQNISGVVINSLDLTGQETYNLSTEGLGTGIYLLKLQSVDKTITRKLIKR